MTDKYIIGRSDKIDLPDLHLFNLDAKIDTGAFTSAIHYHHAEEIVRDGKKVLHFTLLDPTHPDYNDKSFYFEHYDRREIKNSFGETEERYIITTHVTLFGHQFVAELSLSDRGNLKFPILLGRKLLSKGFIVDVSKRNLSYKQKSKKK
ncbi:ATP-dependent zinc protease [Fulvivirga sedimenti]|uniref:RimK/LysX family protein n=1 Tax=Fulvivirga sedimenti TaxID=2879465 RepID=A0A9X1KVN4_9BACT|nr:RimK/LysX family protein [Fulvivirga sedimenti]MCA6073865.1 RimK/LysX family protein [Fulvivirga sedimenti]